MTTETELNEWHDSRNGKLAIRLHRTAGPVFIGGPYQVYALVKGTHDIGYSRGFTTESAAREYANQLWATR
jgi:hypothetical protein